MKILIIVAVAFVFVAIGVFLFMLRIDERNPEDRRTRVERRTQELPHPTERRVGSRRERARRTADEENDEDGSLE